MASAAQALVSASFSNAGLFLEQNALLFGMVMGLSLFFAIGLWLRAMIG